MFRIKHTADGHTVPWEYMQCGAMQPQAGQALYVTGGLLMPAGGSNKAQYICVRNEAAAVASGTEIPVMKIQPDQIWEAPGTADMVVGTGYDVAADGLSVENATTVKNFVVRSVDEVSGMVRGNFVV